MCAALAAVMLVVDRFIRDAACRCFWSLALAVVCVLIVAVGSGPLALVLAALMVADGAARN